MEALPDLAKLNHKEEDALIVALWNHIQRLEERNLSKSTPLPVLPPQGGKGRMNKSLA